MESINPSDIADLDFDSISFITLKTGDMIMIDNSVPKKIKLDKSKTNNHSKKKDTIKQKLSVSKQQNFTYKGKITFNKLSSKYNYLNNQIILKNDFNKVSKVSKNLSFCYKAKYNRMIMNDIQNLITKENPKNSLFQYNHNNHTNIESIINKQGLNTNNNIKSNINENQLNNEKVNNFIENNQLLTTDRNNLNTKNEEMTEEENLDMRIKRKSRNYMERLSLIFGEKNKPLVNAVISLKIPSDVNRQQSETEKEFDMMVAQLKQKRSKYRINVNDHCIYQKYYELYKENNKEVKYFNLNRIKYYQESENNNKENEKLNTNENINNNKLDNINFNNTFYGSINNKGINKSIIGFNDTNANNKTSMSIYGDKIKTPRENKLLSSRIKEMGYNSTLVCPSNNFKDKLDSDF